MMTEDTAELLNRYQRTMADAVALKAEVLATFVGLEAVEDKFKMVLEFGYDFLGSYGSYCEHLELEDGSGISLYDDLYWEKYETKSLHSLFCTLAETHTGKYLWKDDEIRAALLADHIGAINQDTPAAVIARDFLEKAISEATFNW